MYISCCTSLVISLAAIPHLLSLSVISCSPAMAKGAVKSTKGTTSRGRGHGCKATTGCLEQPDSASDNDNQPPVIMLMFFTLFSAKSLLSPLQFHDPISYSYTPNEPIPFTFLHFPLSHESRTRRNNIHSTIW